MKSKVVLKLRESLAINQHEFWTRVGVTQSAGSRYENGRTVPKPVAMLVTLAFGDAREAAKLAKALRK